MAWTEYVVEPFEKNNTGKHSTKQAALEDAQKRAINEPGKNVRVYRAEHHPNTGECNLVLLIEYWFDEHQNKLQYQVIER